MKHRMLISPLTLSLVLLFAMASNALARGKVSELSAAALVQRLAHHTTDDSWTRDEISKRLGWEALPRQRSELIDALLSVAKNTAADPSHRISVIGWLTRHVKGSVVIDAFMEIAMNHSDRLSWLAARKLPNLSRENPRILAFLIEYLESIDPRNFFVERKIIVAIGLCGEIATDTLFDLWNNERYRFGFRTSLYTAFGCTAASSPRTLDFLISQLEEIDVNTMRAYVLPLLSSLSFTASHLTGRRYHSFGPPPPPNYSAASKIRSAVERELRADNHPLTIRAAATAYLYATHDRDLPATVSRLRGFLPYLEADGQEDLESKFRRLSERAKTIQDLSMDCVPAPPLRIFPHKSTPFIHHH